MEAANRLAENASLNLQSAESKIRDTDMVAAIMDYSKEQILSQANMSVLSQAHPLNFHTCLAGPKDIQPH